MGLVKPTVPGARLTEPEIQLLGDTPYCSMPQFPPLSHGNGHNFTGCCEDQVLHVKAPERCLAHSYNLSKC